MATDMADLAELIRALLAADEGKSLEVPIGGNLFDVAVIAAGSAGEAVVAELDVRQGPHGCGPVMRDPDGPWLYLLVPPGTSRRWQHELAPCLGSGRIVLPPLHRHAPPGRYWVRSRRETHLVGPQMLGQALDRHRPSPVAEPGRGLAASLAGDNASWEPLR
ncbi:hypothetical protein ACFWY6_01025 [Streptomyces sp. NPDC059037]|uniref:hypothetical protein n=1 Tax=Streptomyces sp. NPDC059037 TaxID=3346710 RepID=UPI0036B219E7